MTAAEFAAYRRLTGLTADELAKRLQINPRTIRSYESGRDVVPEWAADEIRVLVAENARLGAQMAAAGVPVVIERSGWHIQAAARALLIEPDTMIHWAEHD